MPYKRTAFTSGELDMNFGFSNRDGETVHDWVRERMSPFLDGQLSGEEAARFETHVRSCAECREEFEALRTTRQLLRTMPMARLPRAFTLEAVPKRVALPRAFFFLRAASGVAAAVFVALLAASAVLPVSGSAPAAAPAALRAAQPAATAPADGQHPAAAAAASQAPQREAPAAAESKAAPAGGAAAPALPGTVPAATPQGQLTAPQAPAAAPPAAAAPAPALGLAQAVPTPRPSVPGQPSAPTVERPATSNTGTAADTSRGSAEPSSTVQPGPTPFEPGSSSVTTQAETPAEASSPRDQGRLTHLLLPFQFATGALTLVLALASGAVWWAHRRTHP